MKKETLQEFLARGGKITICPPGPAPKKTEGMKLATTGGPTTILPMEDAELYYGETKATKKTKKATNAVDLSVHLPEALRKKYIDPILDKRKEEQD